MLARDGRLIGWIPLLKFKGDYPAKDEPGRLPYVILNENDMQTERYWLC
jgi:hypothetical protein